MDKQEVLNELKSMSLEDIREAQAILKIWESKDYDYTTKIEKIKELTKKEK
jgi:hypothetical protein